MICTTYNVVKLIADVSMCTVWTDSYTRCISKRKMWESLIQASKLITKPVVLCASFIAFETKALNTPMHRLFKVKNLITAPHSIFSYFSFFILPFYLNKKKHVRRISFSSFYTCVIFHTHSSSLVENIASTKTMRA